MTFTFRSALGSGHIDPPRTSHEAGAWGVERNQTMTEIKSMCAAYSIDIPRHSGSALDFLASCGDSFAVIDDTGRIWAVRATRLGAQRIAAHHRRKHATATNHYARQAQVGPVDGLTLRSFALDEARRTLRAAVEVECEGGWNGGLDSRGAKAALAVLRKHSRYAEWHAA